MVAGSRPPGGVPYVFPLRRWDHLEEQGPVRRQNSAGWQLVDLSALILTQCRSMITLLLQLRLHPFL